MLVIFLIQFFAVQAVGIRLVLKGGEYSQNGYKKLYLTGPGFEKGPLGTPDMLSDEMLQNYGSVFAKKVYALLKEEKSPRFLRVHIKKCYVRKDCNKVFISINRRFGIKAGCLCVTDLKSPEMKQKFIPL